MDVSIVLLVLFLHYCWRNSSGGSGWQLARELDPGNQRLFTPFPVLGISSCTPFPQRKFEDAALRKYSVAETIRTEYVTEPS